MKTKSTVQKRAGGEKKSDKDQAYWERNQLVRALSRIYPSWLGWHKEKDWEDDWRNIVYIKIPVRKRNPIGYGPDNIVDMQVSWHIHEDELKEFDHLKAGLEEWDGHDTDEKYRRLEALAIKP